MNKADLIDAIAKKAEMTKKDAGIAWMRSSKALADH
jgi:nucleoid DNA-binding protein